MQIIRTEEQVNEAMFRAQKVAFDASDNGDTDDVAEMAYGILQWILGHSGVDPTVELTENL